MIILGIETSCDDTGIAVLEANLPRGLKILSNVVSSQVKLHAKYGGVYPALAKREHHKNLPIVLKKTLKQAGNPRVDLIAVTQGPGLEPCLWTGVNFAKDLAGKLGVPLVPVNHIEAHIIANFIREGSKSEILNPEKILNSNSRNSKLFPAIVLVVSGGHTQLILMKGIGKYKLLGETRDDAAGECFDKTARILGLGYPGGPAIAREAEGLKRKTFDRFSAIAENLTKLPSLPRPMIHQKNYDFSFSGLKTAVLYDWKSQSSKIRQSKQYIRDMAAEIQQAVIDVLVHKTFRAITNHRAKAIILGGGVAANNQLREQMNAKRSAALKIHFLAPPKNLCTDNGAMIAAAGYYKWLRNKKKSWKSIKVKANLKL